MGPCGAGAPDVSEGEIILGALVRHYLEFQRKMHRDQL